MSRRLNLLVAEDNENDRLLLELAFSQAQVEANVKFVADGAEAIDYLSGSGQFGDRKRFPMPDLMLLDLMMPRRNGFDVLLWVRHARSCNTLPVIVLSSSAMEQDVERAFALGANSFLQKGASSNALVKVAEGLEAYWVRHNVFPRNGDSCGWGSQGARLPN